ncbi:MAG TPA: hypothetical protein VFU41_01610 [Gemmatimonadales bacterium]|nr:hypothetical protein [Gemmatimonadales bacterium]
MQRLVPLIVLALGASAPTPLLTQVARDAAERTADRRQISVGRAQLAADVADVRRLERLVAELDGARAAGDAAREREAQRRIGLELRGQMGEARRDVAQDRAAAVGARSEVRSDRRELARDRRDAATVQSGAEAADDRRDLRRDRRDLRDDRRDARDDRRDAAASAARATRQAEIVRDLRTLQPDVDAGRAPAVARQRALLDEFLRLAREDARATGRELGEDVRELREDRRETRDDRRERREP